MSITTTNFTMPSNINNGVDTLLKSYCGVYLDTYINEFVTKTSFGDLHKLWKNRQFRILLSPESPIWHIGRVIKVDHEQSATSPGLIYWNLTMEFVTTHTATNDKDGDCDCDLFILGDYVELNNLKKASMYNGRYGVIVSNKDFQKTSRYGVEVRDLSQLNHRPGYDPIKTKQIAVQTKNLSKFITLKETSKKNSNDGISVSNKSQWTWRIHRMNPAIGGTLEGKDQDCSHLISLEWLDEDDDSDTNVNCCSKEQEQIGMGSSWFGTSGYLLHLQDNAIISVRTKDNPVSMTNKTDVNFDVWKFSRIGGKYKNEYSIREKCPIDSFPRCDLSSIIPSKRFTIDGGKYKVENNWAVDVFNRVVTEGNFTIEWSESNDPFNVGMERLSVRFFTDVTGSEAPPIRNPYVLAIAYFSTRNTSDGYFDFGMGSHLDLEYPKAFGDIPFIGLLNNDQYQYVIIRLTHWFLRSHRELQSVLNEFDCIICLLQGIVDCYRSFGARKEALDAAILVADFLYSKSKSSSTICDAQNKIIAACDQVGGILEALGRFRDAAMVYSETGDKFAKDLSLKFQLYSKAGHQYRIVSEYKNSEKCFVKGLSCVRDNKILRLDAIEQIMCNYGEFSACNEDVQSSQEFYMMCTLAALLYVSGVKTIQNLGSIMKNCGENSSEFLKVKYLTPSTAKKVLRMAYSVSNAKEFRKIILNCKKLGKLPKQCLSFHGEKPTKSNMKKIAKENAKESFSVVAPRNTCSSCEKMVENLKECPCRMVYYCSRKCQVSHFPIHKKHCPIQKNKTKK